VLLRVGRIHLPLRRENPPSRGSGSGLPGRTGRALPLGGGIARGDAERGGDLRRHQGIPVQTERGEGFGTVGIGSNGRVRNHRRGFRCTALAVLGWCPFIIEQRGGSATPPTTKHGPLSRRPSPGSASHSPPCDCPAGVFAPASRSCN